MLLNVRNDRQFQRYLDTEEQRLHTDVWPVVSAGMRLQLNRNSAHAMAYVHKRGLPLIMRTYRRIHADAYITIAEKLMEEKARASDGVRAFLAAQLEHILSRATRALANISTTIANDVIMRVWEGVREGRSNEQIVKDIRQQIPDLSRSRAATIARTETHNSALAAIDATMAYKQIDVRTKTWIAAMDARTRPSHARANGQRVAYEAPFTVGESLMNYPGDDSMGAGPEEIINCRCAVIYNTEGG